MTLGWEDLRRRSLARQLPAPVGGTGPEDVVALVARTGPIQTQTARSAFLGIAARLPGVTHADVTAAYEATGLVRGSTIRGTVHTSTPEQHLWLDRATRTGQRTVWARTLGLRASTLEEVWAALEDRTAQGWCTPDELGTFLRGWLADRGEPVVDELATPLGRSLAFSHGGMLRRPLHGGSWETQVAARYRSAVSVLAEGRPDLGDALDDARAVGHEDAMAAVVRLHLACYGPASRRDVAWWSGLGLRVVDGALGRLGQEVTAVDGPDGTTFWDLTDPPTDEIGGGADDVGTRLLPEFDALLCGYHPRARDRFVTSEQHALLWNQGNGLLRAPVLHRGRLAGWWSFDRAARQRRLVVQSFPGVAGPGEADLAPAVAAVEAVLAIEVTDVEIREGG